VISDQRVLLSFSLISFSPKGARNLVISRLKFGHLGHSPSWKPPLIASQAYMRITFLGIWIERVIAKEAEFAFKTTKQGCVFPQEIIALVVSVSRTFIYHRYQPPSTCPLPTSSFPTSTLLVFSTLAAAPSSNTDRPRPPAYYARSNHQRLARFPAVSSGLRL
jgi:hypothetical protein